MTDRTGEPTGRRARWTAAVVLAPGAAALFGATMTWAATTKPTTAGTPHATPVVAPAAPNVHPALTAQDRLLQADALARHHERADLARRLATLQRNLAAIRTAEQHERAAAAAAARSAAAAGSTQNYQAPASGYQPPTQNYQAPAQNYQPPVQNLPPVPAPVQAPVVANPPPVQGTTGGSGKP